MRPVVVASGQRWWRACCIGMRLSLYGLMLLHTPKETRSTSLAPSPPSSCSMGMDWLAYAVLPRLGQLVIDSP